jgi:hypothetical protein
LQENPFSWKLLKYGTDVDWQQEEYNIIPLIDVRQETMLSDKYYDDGCVPYGGILAPRLKWIGYNHYRKILRINAWKKIASFP